MVATFSAIPFTDAIRSRVTGMRLAVSFGISSLAVYALGPLVKTVGFASQMLAMAVIACCTAACLLLPTDPPKPAKFMIGKTGD